MSRARPLPVPDPPGPGRESVWDYPRPARAEPTDRAVRVVFAGRIVAETRQAWRVLETSHPPGYYIPPGDVDPAALRPAARRSRCEWKGLAAYFDVTAAERIAAHAAWAYPDPTPAFRPIAGYVAFYPALMDACFVDGERVVPQEGGFYGGWITGDLAGPFKGPPGTEGW